MWYGSRRSFLATAGGALGWAAISSPAAADGSRANATGLRVLQPRARVPLSFIIDDSTCLVNMGHYCMPQFAEAWPDREAYKKPWSSWPREIPDAFVRQFGEWCAEHGVKGKYSIVPYPACVGWLDRELPGWSRRQLRDSLKLVRELMLPNWDIHPEMITHTRVIDLKTGRPFAEISPATMENSYPREKKSVDELAAYLAYALRILKNCDLPCEGVTTPGGFGNLVKSELSLAVQQALRDVYAVELPHYFKYVHTGSESTEPSLEHVSQSDPDDVRVTVNVPAGTGDWFGGWDGDLQPQGALYANHDATSGRMVEMIERGEPAIMLCHWPGLYNQGAKTGLRAFQQVVTALEGRYQERTIWMKVSEIARYAAARELTRVAQTGNSYTLDAPFACPNFTLQLAASQPARPRLAFAGTPLELTPVNQAAQLRSGSFLKNDEGLVLCFDLRKGRTVIGMTNE